MRSYVLVVDDEEPICTLLRRQLEGWGYAVEIALNATEGLARMLDEPASIAIIDLKMPGRDGLWLAEQIHERWSKTAIIIATGAPELNSIAESGTVGVVHWVLKPFDREQLRQTVTRATAAVRD